MEGLTNRELEIVHTFDASKLVPLSEGEASMQDGMMLNHSYVDLRGAKMEDVAETIAFERQFLRESAELTYDSPEMEDWMVETTFAMDLPVDMGVGSAVEVLSAMGATPISSCNGGAFTSGHSSDVAHVLFSCEAYLVPDILAAAQATNCQVVNNGRHAELYAATVEDLIAFADVLQRSSNGAHE